MVRTHSADFAVGDPQRGFQNFFAEKSPAAVDENVRHDTALRCLVCSRSEIAAGSYFSRKSSTASFLKSGRALRRFSCSQSHHASPASRLVMAPGKRRLILPAGFSATIVLARAAFVT